MLANLFLVFSSGTRPECQIAALQELADHDLVDLGIMRDQIEAYVQGRLSPG